MVISAKFYRQKKSIDYVIMWIPFKMTGFYWTAVNMSAPLEILDDHDIKKCNWRGDTLIIMDVKYFKKV